MRFLLAVCVMTAVNFNDQFSFQTDKINDIVADRMLSAELKSIQSFRPDSIP